ncbi:MAG: hypothetical protein GXO82_01390 [Chlorobi bacterium]|nr:hypothetical protein [Chlorobiota bacterium]
MQDRRHLTAIIFVFFFASITVDGFAQEDTPLYRVNVSIGSGYSYYITSLEMNSMNKHSFNATAKIMWQPEHLLRVGVESGYLPLYTLERKNFRSKSGTTDVTLSLDAVPVMLVFAMELYPGFEVSAGIGGMMLYSSMESFDNKVVSSSWSNGMAFALTWLTPIDENIQVGGEVKWYNVAKIEDSAVAVQVALKYNLLSY